jgi:ABC-type lipoprotein release transport system permease subunit
MLKLLKLAWRDIWRNRRRSLITMSAIVFSLFLITGFHSLQNGTYDAMEEVAVRIFTGDVQVHREGYYDERTFSYAMEGDEYDWDSLADEYEEIEVAARRITGFGLLSSDSSSVGGIIVGIDPAREYGISTFASAPVEGERLQPGDDHEVMLGRTLANNLGLSVGDTVVVLTQGFRNAMGADLYVIKGLLRSGNPEVDRSMMIMTVEDADFLFSMEGRFTELVIKTANFRDSDRLARQLEDRFDSDRFEVMGWKSLLPELQQARAMDDIGNYVFYAFLLIMVGFEIFNTTMMSVMERVREFGVIMSIGMKPWQITLLIAMELILKTLLSVAVGFGIAFIVVSYMHANPIPLPEDWSAMYEDFGFSVPAISFSSRPYIFYEPLMWIGMIAVIALVYPILRMRRFSPLEALRTMK